MTKWCIDTAAQAWADRGTSDNIQGTSSTLLILAKDLRLWEQWNDAPQPETAPQTPPAAQDPPTPAQAPPTAQAASTPPRWRSAAAALQTTICPSDELPAAAHRQTRGTDNTPGGGTGIDPLQIARKKAYCWGKQTEMAAALWMTRQKFKSTLESLLEKGLLKSVKRRQYDTEFHLPDVPIGATELPPKEQPDPQGTPDVPIGASSSQSKTLLDEWNKKFPETIPGANQLLDQNALVQLLDTHHQTPEQIVELMGYIDQSESIGYYTRPFSLIRRSNQGNGPFTFIQLSLKMEAKKNGGRESTDDKIARAASGASRKGETTCSCRRTLKNGSTSLHTGWEPHSSLVCGPVVTWGNGIHEPTSSSTRIGI